MSHEPHTPTSSSESFESDATVDTGDAGAAVAAPRTRALPEAIGGYRIVGLLGEGGMGTVYEAEQESPRRRVALKVIRGGAFVDAARVRMFQREADALARLRHPNIGAIYEAGCTEAGEHFFAMELVRGRRLDAYLSRRAKEIGREEIRFRLRLVAAIADAVHYAHQRGVIHRDLKPSNIVVSENAEDSRSGLPELKILDFGLARITETDVDAATAVTEVGVIKGTLAYMSPEQARGDADGIDLRTDVYSLGVLLYEALTGRRPYDLQKHSIVESVRVICEQPPAPLSHTWSGVRAPDPDLQTIVGKALEKEASRRYGSAEALADDLRRYLDSRPIMARPPGAMYQFRKFAQRNRGLVASAFVALGALVVGIVAATTFGLREAAQRRAAEQARRDTQVVADFQSAMLGAVDPEAMGRGLVEDLVKRLAEAGREAGRSPADVAASVGRLRSELAQVNATDAALRVIDEHVLARARAAADSQFAARPRIRAQLVQTIGDTYFRLGLLEKAEASLADAGRLWTAAAGAEDSTTLDAARRLAGVYAMGGRFADADPLYRATLASEQRVFGPRSPWAIATMNDLAIMLTDQREFRVAESLFAIVLPVQRSRTGLDANTASIMHSYGWALLNDDRFAPAESLLTQALAIRRRVHGPEATETMETVNDLAVLYKRTGRFALAEPLYLEDYTVSRRRNGDEHPGVLVSMTNLGRLYNAEHKFAEAEALLGRAAQTSRRVMPPGFFGTGLTVLAHAEALVGLGRLKDAETEALEAHRILLAAQGADDPAVARAAGMLAEIYARQGWSDLAARWRAKAPPK